MSNRRLPAAALPSLVLATLLGCGGGGELGDECDTYGATTDECEEGLICSVPSDNSPPNAPPVCIRICNDHPDCAPDESCNGVEGSTLKGCRKKD